MEIFMNCCNETEKKDRGPRPYVVNVQQMAVRNPNFRTTIWTGNRLQMTLMSIPPCGDIGGEVHEETDQLIRVEQGNAVVQMGNGKNQIIFQENMCQGSVAFIPAGTWHNVINTGRNSLKISSVYAPPNHPKGTIHQTKMDAQEFE
jgi:mannose-6-phosphate isomerase-like protein (cupin superfamily)